MNYTVILFPLLAELLNNHHLTQLAIGSCQRDIVASPLAELSLYRLSFIQMDHIVQLRVHEASVYNHNTDHFRLFYWNLS